MEILQLQLYAMSIINSKINNKMIADFKVPTYTDVLQIAKNANLGYDSIMYSPSKQLFTVKKNIVTKETPKEFAIELLKNLNAELFKYNFDATCVQISAKKDSKTDELILIFKIK